MKIFNKKKEIARNYKISGLFLIIILVIVVLLFPNSVYAAYAADWVNKLLFGLTWVVFGAVYFLGLLLLLILNLLSQVAKYNGFITADTVVKGWEIVRDLCNMFFILILLIIAFATILRQENYSAKKLLPKLLIMAVLINFSKTICGLIIDFAQVIMLTFVNGFSGGGINNLTTLLGIDKLLSQAKSPQVAEASVTIGSFAGVLGSFFAAAIAFIVIVVMLCVLVMRIIVLWVYVILSPLAYLLAAFPAGQTYSQQWWKEFSNNVIVGPVLAFFLWLALSTAQNVSIGADGKGGSNFKSDLITDIFTEKTFETYIITIALLIGGLTVTQQIGGIAGSIAGKGMAAIQKGKGFAQGKIWGATKSLGKFVGGEIKGQAKSLDATFLGGKGSAALEAVKSGKGATVGAVVGSVAGPIGTIVGGVVGGAVGKFVSNKWKKEKDIKDSCLNASMKGDKGQYLDAEGNKVEDPQFNNGILDDTRVIYRWNDGEGCYNSKVNGEKYVEKNGNAVSRWGEITDADNNQARLLNEKNSTYYKVDSKGEFIKDKDGKNVVAKSAFGINKITKMSKRDAAGWAAYSEVKGKGWGAKNATESEAIEKTQKNYEGKSTEMLRKLLEIEKNSGKRMAIAITLASKKGFDNAGEINKAKESLSGNGLLLKKFNEEMNKRHMVLNNTKKDGTIDEGAIAKIVSSGDAHWKDQDTKTINKDALNMMARQRGNKFSEDLVKMIKTDKDKSNISKALLGKAGDAGTTFDKEDFEIRKAAGEITGKWDIAFTKNGTLNEGELIKGIKKIKDGDVLGDIDDKLLTNPKFQETFVQGLSTSLLTKAKPRINTDKMEKIIEAIKSQGRSTNASANKVANDLITKIKSTSLLRDLL
ncbi:MAG: DMT family transporter [Patescibacteria group bacterium]